MCIYTPYVYLIGWSHLDEYYIGARYKKDVAHPSDLWSTYFTSSKKIDLYREQYGEPDTFLVIKTFTDGEKALDHETKILRRLDARNHPKLINGHNNDGVCHTVGPLSEEHSKKISNALTGKPKSAEMRRKLSENKKGRTHSAEHRRNNSMSQIGRKHSEETKKKMSESRKGKKFGPHSAEASQRQSERQLGKKRGPYRKKVG